MGEWPLLPVVHRANLQQLLGVISLDDVMRAYRGSGPERRRNESSGSRRLTAAGCVFACLAYEIRLPLASEGFGAMAEAI